MDLLGDSCVNKLIHLVTLSQLECAIQSVE
jgi:hypothetical protein